ncbi:hypothetical protein HUW63_24555 [Myxococcus sp. AM001]|nr:hypothetical protein [Myxococcus sp. AM001]
MQTELNASLSIGNTAEKQALALCRDAAAKCMKKRFDSISTPVWILTDLSRTDFLSQYGNPSRTFSEYLHEVGNRFIRLASQEAFGNDDNHLLKSPNILLAYHHRPTGDLDEGILVFPRSLAERSSASALASALNLPLTLIPHSQPMPPKATPTANREP